MLSAIPPPWGGGVQPGPADTRGARQGFFKTPRVLKKGDPRLGADFLPSTPGSLGCGLSIQPSISIFLLLTAFPNPSPHKCALLSVFDPLLENLQQTHSTNPDSIMCAVPKITSPLHCGRYVLSKKKRIKRRMAGIFLYKLCTHVVICNHCAHVQPYST